MQQRKVGVSGSLVAFGVVSALCAQARAGDDQVLIGKAAAMTGGAITATVPDGTGLWFNPAGLARAERSKVNVSANAFVLRLYSAPQLIRSADRAAEGSTVILVPVPSALTYVRPISASTRIGLGIFVPRSNDALLRTDLTVDSAGNPSTQWVMSVADTSSATYVGGGIGHRVSSTFDIGASLFVAYQSEFQSVQFGGGQTLSNSLARFLAFGSTHSKKSIGIEAGVGAQWQVSPRIRLGVSLRSPGVQVFRSTRETNITTAGVVEGMTTGSAYQPEITDEVGFKSGWTTPLRARFGIAYTTPQGFFSLDGDVQPGINSAIDDKRKFTWNLRAGGRYNLTPVTSVGGGVFTDRDPKAREPGGPKGVDFYGLAGGIEFRTSELLADGAAAKDIVFTTMIGIRYAYGKGEVGGLLLPTNPTDVDGVQTSPTSLTIHEFALNLGSALYF